MNEFFYGLGRLFYKIFDIMEAINNIIHPNVIFIIILFICLGVWIKMQSAYNTQADKEGKMR